MGNPSTPLFGDPSEDKVALSGRSAAMLNIDWSVRNHVGIGGGQRYAPPRSYSEGTSRCHLYPTSEHAMAERLRAHHAGERERERQRLRLAQEQSAKEEAGKKMSMLFDRAWQREQNVRYQRLRLAWAHLKAEAEVRVYLRQPVNRLWNKQREQQRKQRQKPTRVEFDGALCAGIRRPHQCGTRVSVPDARQLHQESTHTRAT